jgi:DNA-binding NarL/FixJ family response regulator
MARVLLAGDSPLLKKVFDLRLVDHAHTEGELFLAIRKHQPDVLLIDDTVRPDASGPWFDYLHLLSAHTRLIRVNESDASRKI